MEKRITEEAQELKLWLDVNKNKCFEVEYQDKHDLYNSIIFSDLKFLIKRKLEESGIIVHRNMVAPTDMFNNDKGEMVFPVAKTLGLMNYDIRTTSEEDLSDMVVNSVKNSSLINFSFYKMDTFKVKMEKDSEPIEVLKVRFATW